MINVYRNLGYLYEKGWKQEYGNEKKEVKNMEEEKVMVEYNGMRYFNKEKTGMSILKTVLGKIFLTKDHFSNFSLRLNGIEKKSKGFLLPHDLRGCSNSKMGALCSDKKERREKW